MRFGAQILCTIEAGRLEGAEQALGSSQLRQSRASGCSGA
jgi:hypothetical protein